jgi:hypothetical protein
VLSGATLESLRRAADELCAVTIERGDGGASGFLSHVDEHALYVAPTAATSLAAREGAWTITESRHAWKLRAHGARATDDDTLAFPLESIRWWPSSVERRADLSSLLLACPVGALDLQVFPVVALEPSACVVESSTALPVGHVLPYVELVGDLGVLRVARASVVHVSPWWSDRGTERFRIRCELEARPVVPTWEYDVVDDPATVDHVLDLAAMLARPLRRDHQEVARLERITTDAMFVDTDLDLRGSTPLNFELFGLLYELVVRPRTPRELTRPLLLRRRRFRSEARAPVDPAIALSLEFRHPVDDEMLDLAVVDLSQGGVAFRASDVLLWEGMPIRGARLRSEVGRIDLGMLEVRGVSANRAHARILDDRALGDVRFGHLLARLRHPELAPHDGATFDAQLSLYREAGLVMPYMADRLAHTKERAVHAWRVAHASAPDQAFSFARYEEGEAVASVSALQAWDRTWLAQHLAARRNRRGCSPGELFLAALDHLVLRPDCRRMVFFTTVANAKMNGIQERFRTLTGTPEALAQFRVRAWLVQPHGASGEWTRSATESDLRTLENAARRELGDLPMRALSFDAEHARLERLGAAFDRVGLRRGRRIDVVESAEGIARFALITERCEPGLCVPGLVDATWVLPLHLDRTGDPRGPTDNRGDRGARDARARLVDAIHALPLDTFDRQRLLLVPNTTEAPTPDAEHAFDANVYVFNRAGLRRYVAFLTEAFGEIGARARAREGS